MSPQSLLALSSGNKRKTAVPFVGIVVLHPLAPVFIIDSFDLLHLVSAA